MRRVLICIMAIGLSLFAADVFAVNSQIVRHVSAEDFLAGDSQNITIDSQGNLTLSRQNNLLVQELEDAWVINTIASEQSQKGEDKKIKSKTPLYLGTSPNGIIYKYEDGKLEIFYAPEKPIISESAVSEDEMESKEPAQSSSDTESQEIGTEAQPQEEEGEPAEDSDQPETKSQEQDETEQESHLLNEHVFALGYDKDGSLLAGISGQDCRLLRFKDGQAELLFKPQQAFYIFDILKASDDKIYVATGPEGKLYSLEPDGSNPDLVYNFKQKNVLSLAAKGDSSIYVGVDEEGIIYRYDIEKSQANVVYDSEQDDITSMAFDNAGNLYVAAASTKAITSRPLPKIAAASKAGRAPEQTDTKSFSDAQGVLRLHIANSMRGQSSKSDGKESRPASNKGNSFIYKISPEGFVYEIFSDAKIFLSLAVEGQSIVLATGNDGELFSIDMKTERVKHIYKDKLATQLSSVSKIGDRLFVGTANPARMIEIEKTPASEGFIESQLIDAAQPARWGKIQLDADIPNGCEILVASRSGNSSDKEDQAFTPWTDLAKLEGPQQMLCPVGRFAQYKLVLKGDSENTPIIRQVALAHLVENIAPKIVSLSTEPAAELPGKMNVVFEAVDANEDTLEYEVFYRNVGRERWIEISDEIQGSPYQWDSKTVEDGTYEFKLIASDARSNSPTTFKTATWISEPFVVDNTKPEIQKQSLSAKKEALELKISVTDQLSMISSLAYTVNSDKDWTSTLPDDLVFDTIQEDFTIQISDLDQGEHVIAVKAADDADNVSYRSFFFEIK